VSSAFAKPCDGSPLHRLETIMTGMVQVIGLGRGRTGSVDPRPEQTAEQRAAADPEAIQNSRKGCFEIVQPLPAWS